MQKICPNCNKLFEAKDKVRATIISYFVPLKSTVAYALEKPEECLDVIHANCQYPKGGPDGD